MRGGHGMTPAAHGVADRLHAAPARQRSGLLMDFLRGQIAEKLAVEPSEVEPRGQLMALGMTSLQAMELKTELESQLGIPLRSSLLFDYPTLEALVPFIIDRLGFTLDTARPSRPAPPPASGPPLPPTPVFPPPAFPPAEEQSAEALAAALAAELEELRRG
jgi:acyl carrier protein